MGLLFTASDDLSAHQLSRLYESDCLLYSDQPDDTKRRLVEARRVEEGVITIDGRLDEPAWEVAQVASGFIQRVPDTGEPATDETQVRILYDDRAIYIGARLYDSAPDSIVGTLFRRDGNEYSDWFGVAIDSYNDDRTAFAFAINPRGVRRDLLLYDDDQEDVDWDAVWEAAASIDDEGWTAEIKIPLSQLRYNGGEEAERSWGINFLREIARKGEVSYWSPTPPDASGIVSRFGRVINLSELVDVSRLEILPYLSGQLDRTPGVPDDPFRDLYDPGVNLGADVKYGIGSNMTLTATFNPDFGQVEVDPAEVNLTAFETFFSERRPFFLEGADIFNFEYSTSFNLFDIPQIFYSRRIGRQPQGVLPEDAVHSDVPTQTPIAGALKLSGKTTEGWSVGMLNTITLEQNARFSDTDGDIIRIPIEPLSNFSVVRLQRDFRDGQTVAGVMGTGLFRNLPTDMLESRLTDQALMGGFDFEHSWSDRRYRFNGRFAGSSVTGDPRVLERLQQSSARYYQRPDAPHLDLDTDLTSMQGVYGDLTFTTRTRHWMSEWQTYHISPGFEVNDMGFQTAADRHGYSGLLVHIQPSPLWIFRQFDLWVAGMNAWNYNGDHVNNMQGTGGSFQFRNFWRMNYEIAGSVRIMDDRLTRGGPLVKSPAGLNFFLNASSDTRKDFRVSANYQNRQSELGEYNRHFSLSFRYRPHPAANLTFSPTFENNYDKTQYVEVISDAQAVATFGNRYIFADLNQTTLSAEIRADWTFTPDLSLQLFVQPFVSAGEFTRFKQLNRSQSFDYDVFGEDLGAVDYEEDRGIYVINPDGNGNYVSAFEISDPDFNIRSLRGNAVLRWEFRPGSTLFLVWQQMRESEADHGIMHFSRDYGELFRSPVNNTFLVKFSYWFGY